MICGDFATCAPFNQFFYCFNCFKRFNVFNLESDTLREQENTVRYFTESRSDTNKKALIVNEKDDPIKRIAEMRSEMYRCFMYDEWKTLRHIEDNFYKKEKDIKPKPWWRRIFK